VSRFLTSSPDEEDITTALDEVLEDWSAPVLVGLTLEVNRAGVEAMGRLVSVVSPGPASAIDLGDLPAGRPVWVAGRVASGTEPLSFQLRGNAELIAQLRADGKKIEPALKALFGADRLRRLEYVMNGHFSNDELCTELSRLGCEVPPSSGPKLYPENVQRAAAESVRVILVRESLECGLPSSETAFVAVREEPGQPLTETRIVANALPKGWSDGSGGRLLAGGGYGGSRKFAAPSAPADDELRFTMMDACTDISGDVFEDEVDSETLMGLGPVAEMDDLGAPAPPPVSGMASASAIHFPQADSLVNRLNLRSRTADRPDDERVQDTLRVVVRPGQHAPADGSVLHDAITENGGHFTYVAISFADTNPTVDSVNPELTLLLFVGDLASPRARVKLENVLRQGGRRPLNLRHAAGEPIRMVLSDPAGAWKSGIPPLEIVLG
jgi:Ca-activated chloride channel family protein